MPIFDYRCRSCGQTSELLVRSSSPPVCPQCGSAELDKQVAAPAPAGRTADMLSAARKVAKAEGHFSHYSARERGKIR